MHVTSESEYGLTAEERVRARRRVRRWKRCWDEIQACLDDPNRSTDEMGERISAYLKEYIL